MVDRITRVDTPSSAFEKQRTIDTREPTLSTIGMFGLNALGPIGEYADNTILLSCMRCHIAHNDRPAMETDAPFPSGQIRSGPSMVDRLVKRPAWRRRFNQRACPLVFP